MYRGPQGRGHETVAQTTRVLEPQPSTRPKKGLRYSNKKPENRQENGRAPQSQRAEFVNDIALKQTGKYNDEAVVLVYKEKDKSPSIKTK